MCEQIRAWGWRLDVLVHNAAMGRFQPLLEARPAEWDIALRTNAHALLLLTREALDLFARGARIVAVSSLGSHRYVPFYGAIGPSKAALESVVRTLAVELAPRGIRVNAASGVRAGRGGGWGEWVGVSGLLVSNRYRYGDVCRS